jgi:hypothetical protein
MCTSGLVVCLTMALISVTHHDTKLVIPNIMLAGACSAVLGTYCWSTLRTYCLISNTEMMKDRTAINQVIMQH